MGSSFVHRTSSLMAALFLLAGGCRSEQLFSLDGMPVDPLREAHGHVTVLLFVRTDCPISNRYAPEIQRMERKYAAQARFWLVYPGAAQTPAAIRAQTGQFGYQTAVLRDTKLLLTKRLGIAVTPEAAVFSGSGALEYHGRIDNRFEDFGKARASATVHDLDDAIDAVAAGKSPRAVATPAVGCSVADLDE